MAFWRWGTAQEETGIAAQQLASIPASIRHLSGSASRRAVRRYPGLAPADGSVEEFVGWMRKLGLAGADQEQIECYAEYRDICTVAGFPAVPLKRFKRALQRAGCVCWQADIERSGKRYRPEMVRIPERVPTTDRSLASATEGKAIVLPLPATEMDLKAKANRRRVRHPTSTGTLGRRQKLLSEAHKNKSGRALPYGSEKHSEVMQAA